jgi:hypothetical protein
MVNHPWLIQHRILNLPSFIPMPKEVIIIHPGRSDIIRPSHLHDELLIEAEFFPGLVFMVTLQGAYYYGVCNGLSVT